MRLPCAPAPPLPTLCCCCHASYAELARYTMEFEKQEREMRHELKMELMKSTASNEKHT